MVLIPSDEVTDISKPDVWVDVGPQALTVRSSSIFAKRSIQQIINMKGAVEGTNLHARGMRSPTLEIADLEKSALSGALPSIRR